MTDDLKKVAIIGPVNTGKSTLYNLLLDDNRSETSSLPGTTKIKDSHDFGPFLLIDTPGASESIGIQREEMAYEAAREADFLIILFDNTFRRDGRELYQRIQKLGKPSVIAINKIDIWDKVDEKDRFINHVSESLAIPNVIGISATKKIGINQLMRAIITIDSDLMLSIARYLPKYRRIITHRFIAGASASAGVLGASPIPIADFFPLTTLQAGLILKIAKIYGYEIDLKRSRELLVSFAGGFGLREAARQGLKIIPGYGWIVSGGIAAAGTYALGAVAVEFFNAEQSLSEKQISEIFKNYFRSVKNTIVDKFEYIWRKRKISTEEKQKLLEAEFTIYEDKKAE